MCVVCVCVRAFVCRLTCILACVCTNAQGSVCVCACCPQIQMNGLNVPLIKRPFLLHPCHPLALPGHVSSISQPGRLVFALAKNLHSTQAQK